MKNAVLHGFRGTSIFRHMYKNKIKAKEVSGLKNFDCRAPEIKCQIFSHTLSSSSPFPPYCSTYIQQYISDSQSRQKCALNIQNGILPFERKTIEGISEKAERERKKKIWCQENGASISIFVGRNSQWKRRQVKRPRVFHIAALRGEKYKKGNTSIKLRPDNVREVNTYMSQITTQDTG